MTQPTKNEHSIRTILHFLDKYIIQNSPAFTLDMYKERGILSLKDDIASGILGGLNKSYDNYLNNNTYFCKALINDIGQEHALRKGGRENTNRPLNRLDITDSDFDELCKAADTLKIVSSPSIDTPIDFIVIPGALQKGVETRMNTVLKHLKEHPKFQGKILVFGSSDRQLHPFTATGDEKETMTFEIMADMINRSQDSSPHTSQSIQTMLREQYKSVQNCQTSLSETEITEKLSRFWKEKSGMEWPTEYQMIQRLNRKKLKFYTTELVETLKKDSNSAARATTQDEAFYVADKIKELSQQKQKQNPKFIPSIAVVTNYGYQIETYRSSLVQQVPNFEINMLSPYHSTKDFFSYYKLRPHVKDKSETETRSVFAIELLDAFSRLIFSQNPQCRLEKAVKIWAQKTKIKGRG